ncbi:MAG TPA: hypothetical protein VMW10_04855 [Alphaproteobacteria bacterium]|nr:hypothetical protein [Alphaproteobacteria bacterium]
MNKIKRIERGWAGHFCCAAKCLFRRNTLIEYGDKGVVISTVGALYFDYPETTGEREFTEVCNGAYYETQVFWAGDNEYKDADVSRSISFEAPWKIKDLNDEVGANNMHETAVNEIIHRLIGGYL